MTKAIKAVTYFEKVVGVEERPIIESDGTPTPSRWIEATLKDEDGNESIAVFTPFLAIELAHALIAEVVGKKRPDEIVFLDEDEALVE